MESSSDKERATKYLLGPLREPEPSDECGPGSSFYPISPRTPSTKRPISSSSKPTGSNLPTPPNSASSTRTTFHPSNPYSPSYRQEAFFSPRTIRRSLDDHLPLPSSKNRQRNPSPLLGRFPGDMSHRPLDQLRKEAKEAHRSPHLRKKHQPKADSIDILDMSVPRAYHHEGPYDAVLAARNTNLKTSPVAATQGTNDEAIRATPRDHLKDSLNKHVPLQGTAVVPPGMAGLDGRVMDYEEGADVQREDNASGGAYKRWPGMQYHPSDLKGKGEPSYSIERALKDHKHSSHHRRIVSDGDTSSSVYEMQSHPQHHNSSSISKTNPTTLRRRSVSGKNTDTLPQPHQASSARSSALPTKPGNEESYSDFQREREVDRRHSTGRSFGAGLKKRLGGLGWKSGGANVDV